MEKRGQWSSRFTFILAAVGSAVGLGNAWRFPGLAAKHGGGTFLVVYLFAMLVMGIPLLMMEISIARKFRKGAVESLRGVGKKWEPVGWAATSNAFVIVCYYAVVFAWVILMFINSWQFSGMTHDNEAASGLFFKLTHTTGAIDGTMIPGQVLLCLFIAWGLIFFCIRNGAKSVGKVVKFTVFAPVALLLIMAIKGCTMDGAMDGIKMLFVPDVSAFSDPTLWVDAIGQVFYSLSIMMAIMFAYGSYLGDDADIAADAMIIAFSDMAISVLSGIVMFSTMGGSGMLDQVTASGIGTAFIVYPQAIVNLTDLGWFNALFGAIFYLMLITLAIDSAFSIVEGVSAAVSDKFHLKPKTVTLSICAIAGVISILFVSQAGLAWLDIVDNWANNVNLILIGVFECIAIGWTFNLRKVLSEVNKNASPKYSHRIKWGDNTSIQINKRNIISGVILSIITFGIYSIYWRYILVKNIRAIKQNESGCLGEMLLIVFVPFYSIYWWYSRGRDVSIEFSNNGYSSYGNKIAYLILAILGLDIISLSIMQNDFNSLSVIEKNFEGKRKIIRTPYWWFAASIKFIAPALLIGLFTWNMITLFGQNGGSYSGYPIWAQVCAGWVVSALVFLSGFIAKIIIHQKKKKGFVEDEVVWED